MSTLSSAEANAVRDLVARARAADGVAPLNEAGMLALTHSGDRGHQLVRTDGRTIGYAQADPDAGTAQLVVDPDHRRRGHGSDLLARVFADGATGVWAFGDLPPARAFAAARGLRPVRSLLVMARELVDIRPTPPPEGTVLRGFTPDDAEAFHAVNARAFADHPEQGRLSRADLDARMAEPWFDSDGLILAVDAEGLAGYHWTKRHDDTTGEVYVLGIEPRAQGRGLGCVLLQAGLAHLAAQGRSEVILFVEADNTPAVGLYRREGFEVRSADTLYAPIEATPQPRSADPRYAPDDRVDTGPAAR